MRGLPAIPRPAVLAAIGVGFALVACGEDRPLPTDAPNLPPILAIHIAQRLPSLFAGDTLQLHADIVFEGEQDPDSLASVAWTSLDPVVAAVDEGGLVVGVSPGSAARIVVSTAAVADTVHVVVVPSQFGVEQGLSYIETDSSGWRLYRATLDGAPRQLISDSAYSVRSYDWADVTNLRLTNYGTSDSAFSVVGPADGAVVLTLPVATRDGRWEPGVPNRIAFRDGGGGLFVLDVNGAAPVSFSVPDGEDHAWSPDGRQIAFHTFDGRLMSVPLDGSPATEFQIISQASSVAWSPDGKRIAFNTPGAAWVIAAHGDGSTLRNLVPACAGFGTCPTPRSYSVPAWASDAHRVAYTAGSSEGCVLFVLDVATRAAESITPSPCGAEVAWSPDDRWIAFASSVPADGVAILAADGSEGRFLEADGSVRQVRWIP